MIVEKVSENLVVGEAFQPYWTVPANTMSCKKVLQLLFETLIGTTFLYNSWASDDIKQGNSDSITTDQCTAGFTHIREKGPRSNAQNEFVEWTDQEVNSQESPIFGWSEGKVKESLANYSKGKTGASTYLVCILHIHCISTGC